MGRVDSVSIYFSRRGRTTGVGDKAVSPIDRCHHLRQPFQGRAERELVLRARNIPTETKGWAGTHRRCVQGSTRSEGFGRKHALEPGLSSSPE